LQIQSQQLRALDEKDQQKWQAEIYRVDLENYQSAEKSKEEQ